MFRWLVFPFWAISRNSATLPGDFICCFLFVCLFVCFWRRRESHAGHGRRGYRPSVIQIRGGGLSGIIQTSTPTLRWQETIHQKKNDVPRQFYLASQKKTPQKENQSKIKTNPTPFESMWVETAAKKNCYKKKKDRSTATCSNSDEQGSSLYRRRGRKVRCVSVCVCVCV